MLRDPVRGPRRFFFYSLFESDRTGAPLAWRNRAAGTIDDYAAAVGRWLVTRDGFDFLVFYLSDYDYASHAHGPDAAHAALARSDARDRRRSSRRPAASTPSSSATPWSSAPTTARRASTGSATLEEPFAGVDGSARHRVQPRRAGLPP